MKQFKDNTSEAVFNYYDTVIYPDQFKQVKNGTIKLRNHIIQITKGHSVSDKGILQLLRRYITPDYTEEQMLEALSEYNQSWKSICNYDYFTKAIEVLGDEAFEYYTGADKTYRRTIKPIEYRFVLNKISTIIFKSLKNGSKSGVAYSYFLNESSGITDDYKKVCHRSIIRSTLNHILKHLEHHKLIHRVGNDKNSYNYYIGSANPMYALSIVPDLDESQLREINFKTDREKDFESAVISLRADVKDKDAQIAELKAQLAAKPAQEQPTTEPEPVVKEDPTEITRLAEKHEAEQLGTQCCTELDMVETSAGTCFDNMGLRFEGGRVQEVSRNKGYGPVQLATN